MDFTDHELMMLEQLTYLDDTYELGGCYPPAYAEDETIATRLKSFNETILQRMEANGEEGQQWAAMIRYIKGNDRMMQLRQGAAFYGPNGDYLGNAYYYDSSSEYYQEGKGLVTFRGTTTARDWHDNGVGLGTADTPVQEESFAYIEKLEYTDITVVGHSKGGNMAQYNTIRSDKVTRCVSMDGQGFSGEFLEKYADKIAEKGHLVTNYSLSTDFVHILLNEMPNSTQKYCAGSRVDDITQNHYSNSFFQYHTVEGSNHTVLVTDESGPMVVDDIPENETMTYLHGFTCYVLNNMPIEDRVKMGDYVGNILQLAMEDDAKVGQYTDPLKYAISEPDQLGKVLVYFGKYVAEEGITKEQVMGVLEMLGMDDISFDMGSLPELIKRITGDSKNSKNYSRDFSDLAREKMLKMVEQVEQEKWGDFTDWVGDRWYDFEELIGVLDIRHYINNVNSYHKKVIDKNNATADTINKIFDQVHLVDGTHGRLMGNIKTSLTQWGRFIDRLAEIVEPGKGRYNGQYITGTMNKVMQDISQANVRDLKDRILQTVDGQVVLNRELLEQYITMDSSQMTAEERMAISQVQEELQKPEILMALGARAAAEAQEQTGLEKFWAKAKPYAIHTGLMMLNPALSLQYITSGVIFGDKLTAIDPERKPKFEPTLKGPGYETDKTNVDAWLGRAHVVAENEWAYGEVNAYVGKVWAGADIGFSGIDNTAKFQEDKTGKQDFSYTERYAGVKAKAGAEGSILAADKTIGFGNDMFGLQLDGETSLGNAELIAEGRFYVNDNGISAYARGSAMVSAAEKSVSATVNFLGIKTQVTLSGHAGAYGGTVEAGIKDNGLHWKVGAAKLFGVSLGVNVGFNDTGWENFVDYLTFWN